jgi:hypothetical protein
VPPPSKRAKITDNIDPFSTLSCFAIIPQTALTMVRLCPHK